MDQRRGAHGALTHGFVVATVSALALLMTACTTSNAAAKPSTPTKAEINATCMRIADALADGPDPAADPVGYALAQVLPLRQITTKDAALKTDIDRLASAYDEVYKTNDKSGTEQGVNVAGKKIDTICPGAF